MAGRVFNLRGAPWRWLVVKKMPKGWGNAYGLATRKNPADGNAGGTIRISAALTDLHELETSIHEPLHACLWDTDEVAIHETARDIAALLWRLGYRRTEPPSG
jgi:hypothetical protein